MAEEEKGSEVDHPVVCGIERAGHSGNWKEVTDKAKKDWERRSRGEQSD